MSNNKAIRLLRIAFLSIFVILFVNIAFLSITGHHLLSGADIRGYKKEHDTKTQVVNAKRGNIYDRNGEIIAKDTYTYKVVAYLNKSRYDDINDRPAYVTNPSEYAKKLSPILKIDENELEKTLSKGEKKDGKDGLYQTELGNKGKGLNISVKEKIDKLKLPGIEFEETITRTYPNGVFASSTIGYAAYDEKEKRIAGKLGVEDMYDEYLKGDDGFKKFEVDGHGFEKRTISEKKSSDGNDVYLTIDNNIQRLLESNMDEMLKSNGNEMALGVITDAKTNEILAVSNRPTFNPNKLNIKDYTNPFVSLVFEPGSTMKTFTYASAMDSKKYNGNAKFYSGPIDIKDNGRVVQTIKNYENNNWGSISYDEGYMRSSNTGIINLFNNYLDTKTFEEYLDKFGFFAKTGVDIPGENNGRKVMGLKQEKYTTGFGQASSITPVQLIQAFTAITNDGNMMKPYITEKIVDNKGEIKKENKPQKVGQPISKKTSKQMLNLMSKVVEDERGTGNAHYKIDNYKIAGKTGTAEYVENGRYLTCGTCYYTSFLAGAPASDPDIIFYLVTKRDESPSYAARGKMTKNVMSNTLAYLNSENDKGKKKSTRKNEVIQLESFINKSVAYSKKKLDNKNIEYVVLGNGKKVINQSPVAFEKVSRNQRVFLLSDDNSFEMLDLEGYSKADVIKYASMLDIKVEFKGNGYVTKQNIKPGKTLNKKHTLKVNLE
ncbi:MAG: penicillin-binding protein [Erysipelotrichales bacterium]